MGALLALLSSVSWGTGDFIGGVLTRRLPALTVYCLSQLSGLVLLVVVAVAARGWQAPTGYVPWAVAASLAGMFAMTAFYTALATGRMGIVSPVTSLSVVVPLAVGLLVKGEQPLPLQILGLLAAVSGVLLASGPELSGEGTGRPVFLALGAALGFGVMFVGMAEGSAYSPVMTPLVMRTTSIALSGAVLLARRSTGGASRRDIAPLAAIGVLDAGANLLFSVATTLGLLSLTSVLGSLYPVMTAVLAAVFLHERLRAVQYVGVAVALTGVALITAGG